MAASRLKLAFLENKGRMAPQAPYRIPDGYSEESVNVEFWLSGLGRKRAGATATTGTGYQAGIGGDNPGVMLYRHVPGSNEAAAELWTVSFYGSAYRYVPGGAFTLVTGLVSTVDSYHPLSPASLNGKLFLQAASGNNLVVWDGTTLRYAGMGAAAVPSVANTGSGSYAATIRYYKVCYTTQVTGVTTHRGELSAAVSFTPSGSGTAARVTKPAALTGYGETHWELYASPDNLTYYKIATTVVATTTYDDSATPSAYTGDQPPLIGENLPLPNASYLCVDGNRLVMAGNLTAPVCRVWWTPRIGSGVGDDERVPQTQAIANYVDIGENDGDIIMGISPRAINGIIYVFKRRHIYKLIATGDVNAPYQVVEMQSRIGTIDNRSVVMGETETGNSAVYFLSTNGPYRVTADGVEYLGLDIEDLWQQHTGQFWSWLNFRPQGLYYPLKKQVLWWVNDATNGLARCYRFDARLYSGGHGGWSYDTSTLTSSISAVSLYASAIATSVGDLVPYLATGTTLYRGDYGTKDGSAAYQAYIKLPLRTPAGALRKAEMLKPELMATAQATTSIQVKTVGDFGLTSLTPTVSIAAVSSETHVIRKVEGAQCGDITTIQYTLGDASALDSTWNLDAFAVEAIEKAPR
jgi:hypothetical protein